MVKTRTQIGNVGEIIDDLGLNYVLPKLSAAPNSAVINRAPLHDDSGSLYAANGVSEVIICNGLQRIENESGSIDGRSVYQPIPNDSRIRFVGNEWYSYADAEGSRPLATGVATNQYVEVTFYGTGLVLYTIGYTVGMDFRVTVDGGSESANILDAAVTYANAAGSRRTQSRDKVLLVKGLTLGLHTVRVRKAATPDLGVEGFEILNESSNLTITPGAHYKAGNKYILSTLTATSPISGFDSGTLGTRGGRVLGYLKEDGTIGKAVTPAGATPLYLSSADHSNEELVGRLNYARFGAQLTTDFSTLSASDSAAYVLDDGTTVLRGVDIQQETHFEYTALRLNQSSSNYVVLEFVGTGLDLFIVCAAASRAIDGIYVDGNPTSVGSYSAPTTFSGIVKIVSGLKYGTHTVEFRTNNVAISPGIYDFLIYGPKKPALPAGALELFDYNVAGNFEANTTAAVNTISQGVVRNSVIKRTLKAEGTGGSQNWGLASIVGGAGETFVGGFNLATDRNGAYIEFGFWGTGFDFRWGTNSVNNRSTDVGVSLNGTALTTANFPTASFSTYGGGTIAYNASTGSLNQEAGIGAQNGNGFIVSNLPLAYYTVRFTNNVTSSFLVAETLDAITPFHINDFYKGPASVRSLRLPKPAVIPQPGAPDLSRAKAWLDFSYTTVPRLTNAFNVSGVVEVATGGYIIFFTKPFKNNRYAVAGVARKVANVDSPNIIITDTDNEATKTRNYLYIEIRQQDGNQVNRDFSLILFGELEDE